MPEFSGHKTSGMTGKSADISKADLNDDFRQPQKYGLLG